MIRTFPSAYGVSSLIIKYERSRKQGNGQLLAAGEQAGFDVMVTSDQNIRYQQNLEHFRFKCKDRFLTGAAQLREYAMFRKPLA